MADYKAMYFELFHKITDVIEELKEVQRKAEEIYLDTTEEENNLRSGREHLTLLK